MSRANDALNGVQRLLLDTNPVVYIIERNEEFFERTWSVLSFAVERKITLVVSPLTLVEVLSKESLTRSEMQSYVDFCTGTEEVESGSISFDVQFAIEVGRLRRITKLKTPDCIQLACASALHCDAILTNDKDYVGRSSCKVILLSEIDTSR